MRSQDLYSQLPVAGHGRFARVKIQAHIIVPCPAPEFRVFRRQVEPINVRVVPQHLGRQIREADHVQLHLGPA